MDDAGQQPADPENQRGGQHVGKEGQRLVNHALHRTEEPFEVQGAEDGRQKQQKDKPIDRLAHGV